MRKYNRIFLIVLDSLGIGAMADSEKFGDVGVNTFGHIWESQGGLEIPNLRRLGMGNLCGVTEDEAKGYARRLNEASNGKDTMTGHWEMMGIYTTKPFVTFTDHGFPKELIDELEKRTGRKIIGNKAASGTEILDELAEREIENGELIVYTSADSVLQICGNEETFGLEELYRCCRLARKLMTGEHGVGRIIARPFVGEPGSYVRTSNRHDFSLDPPGDTLLDRISAQPGLSMLSVGKIVDIFAGRGVTEAYRTENNAEGIERAVELTRKDFNGLCFVNLVDFDMLYGHRNDVDGYANALTEFDVQLRELLPLLRPDDLLFITADHGCDPSTPSTDHSREHVPMLAYGAKVKPGVNIGTRSTYADLAATVAEYLGVKAEIAGESFLKEILK